MFNEIMKITPKIDEKALNDMERSLQSRFTKVAKSFGKGIANIFKGGGIAGIALALIDKILNPLQEIQAAIDKTLHSSDDIATNAKQFNTSSGRLFKLVQLARGAGLDQDALFMLMTKFQGTLAQAKANPNDPNASSVKNFVGRTDTAEAFFEFIQSLKEIKDKDQQVLVQQQVFGEKQILKMSDFLNSDFPKMFKEIGLDKVSTDKLTGSIEKLGNLNDLKDVLEAKRNTTDIVSKAGVINESMIRQQDAAEQARLARENKQIQSYNDLAKITQTVDQIMGFIQQGLALIGKLIALLEPAVSKGIGFMEKLSGASIMRGIGDMFKSNGKNGGPHAKW